jgi:hypothetical protein
MRDFFLKKKKFFLTFSIDKNCISQYNPNQALIYNPISSSYINNMRDDSMQRFFFLFFLFFFFFFFSYQKLTSQDFKMPSLFLPTSQNNLNRHHIQ